MSLAGFKLNLDNPLLDEDDDESYPSHAETFNPVLDDEEDEVVTAPVASTSKPAATRPTHNPLDDRLGNLSGTPRPTSHKKKTTKKYRRRYITPNDLKLLKFLALFKMSNSTQVAQLLGVKTNTAHKRLLGLQEAKMVGCNKDVLGAKLPWFVTGNGLKTLETADEFDLALARRMRETDLETSEIGHYLAVNQVAIQLLTGRNAFGIKDWKRKVSVEDFTTEYQIDSALGEWRTRNAALRTDAQTVRKWRQQLIASGSWGEPSHYDPSPMVQYVVLASWRLRDGKQFRIPDLVLRAENNIENIAIEVETSVKATSEYKRIIAMYLEDERHESYNETMITNEPDENTQALLETKRKNLRMFAKVVWVCNSTKAAARITKAIQELAEEARYYDAKSYMKVVPLRDWDGEPFTGKAWRL